MKNKRKPFIFLLFFLFLCLFCTSERANAQTLVQVEVEEVVLDAGVKLAIYRVDEAFSSYKLGEAISDEEKMRQFANDYEQGFLDVSTWIKACESIKIKEKLTNFPLSENEGMYILVQENTAKLAVRPALFRLPVENDTLTLSPKVTDTILPPEESGVTPTEESTTTTSSTPEIPEKNPQDIHFYLHGLDPEGNDEGALSGAWFVIGRVHDGRREYLHADGTFGDKDGAVLFISGEDGLVSITGFELPAGEYFIEEIQTSSEIYTIDPTPQYVIFLIREDGSSTINGQESAVGVILYNSRTLDAPMEDEEIPRGLLPDTLGDFFSDVEEFLGDVASKAGEVVEVARKFLPDTGEAGEWWLIAIGGVVLVVVFVGWRKRKEDEGSDS
ncbi:LPXTG-motif cell wall anchor domain-containing protein [Pilibacter termitis]|uniref:LPXTG-motif cell wall anchor domain-containing protein n=1 Tax=Pilibacter termitis TaxID=263852 RepID=A0A1T4KBW0_9ENTE|nr:LPXTG cell wall anchor domain-containing protein [Pilibacter termitis]SJZ39934.1 LPXTG-motif cell wall anchor domain-containing protein [Pilibacter termitis]